MGGAVGAREARAEGALGGEDALRVVHEVLQELLVLDAELLAGGLEAVDLVELVLLLGQGLANDLAGLLVGIVADALRVGAGVLDELVGGLLGHDEDLRDLVLGGRRAGLDGLCGGRGGDDGRGGRGGLALELGDLGLGGGELLLGDGQATLEVGDLLEHGVDLGGELLEEGVDLLGVVAVLRGREGLLLDVCWCDCHSCSLSSGGSVGVGPVRTLLENDTQKHPLNQL